MPAFLAPLAAAAGGFIVRRAVTAAAIGGVAYVGGRAVQDAGEGVGTIIDATGRAAMAGGMGFRDAAIGAGIGYATFLAAREFGFGPQKRRR